MKKRKILFRSFNDVLVFQSSTIAAGVFLIAVSEKFKEGGFPSNTLFWVFIFFALLSLIGTMLSKGGKQ